MDLGDVGVAVEELLDLAVQLPVRPAPAARDVDERLAGRGALFAAGC
jgi:hypothetical protein